jgi:hypothetical protein
MEEKTNRELALKYIENERDRQIQLWGTEDDMLRGHNSDWREYLIKKLVILMEEVGELSKEALEQRGLHALTEAVQVAAVSLAIVEGLLCEYEQ